MGRLITACIALGLLLSSCVPPYAAVWSGKGKVSTPEGEYAAESEGNVSISHSDENGAKKDE